eukprot:2417207-Rhodomonas_salina.2
MEDILAQQKLRGDDVEVLGPSRPTYTITQSTKETFFVPGIRVLVTNSACGDSAVPDGCAETGILLS